MQPHDVTSDDSTPFAQARRADRRLLKLMRRWIYTAGMERLSHLGLIRRSAASRSFARRHLFLLAAAGALVQVSRIGWHPVVRTPDNMLHLVTAPEGSFWVRVTSSDDSPITTGLIALWWNPVQSAVGLAAGLLGGVLAAYALLVVMNFGAGVVLGHPYRSQERLRGAIHYFTAFAKPICVAAWILLLVPACQALAAAGWRWVPPSEAIFAAAALVASVAGLFWWFWLIRLAMTLPPNVRVRVATYYAMAAPLLAAALLIGWWEGTGRIAAWAASSMGLSFQGA